MQSFLSNPASMISISQEFSYSLNCIFMRINYEQLQRCVFDFYFLKGKLYIQWILLLWLLLIWYITKCPWKVHEMLINWQVNISIKSISVHFTDTCVPFPALRQQIYKDRQSKESPGTEWMADLSPSQFHTRPSLFVFLWHCGRDLWIDPIIYLAQSNPGGRAICLIQGQTLCIRTLKMEWIKALLCLCDPNALWTAALMDQ